MQKSPVMINTKACVYLPFCLANRSDKSIAGFAQQRPIAMGTIGHNFNNNNAERKTTKNVIMLTGALLPCSHANLRHIAYAHDAQDDIEGYDANAIRRKSVNQAAIAEALTALQEEGIGVGPAWERAHQLAQNHEGVLAFDRLHAFLHRVEGDSANAGYWYRRSDEPIFDGDLASECRLLLERCREGA